jgi:multidrug efflux pump subunit AcrB
MTLREAVQYAVRVRLRPILMTSLATIIGLLRILVLLLVVARSAPAEIYHHSGDGRETSQEPYLDTR